MEITTMENVLTITVYIDATELRKEYSEKSIDKILRGLKQTKTKRINWRRNK